LDEGREPLALADDDVEILLALRVARHAARLEHLTEHPNERERRLQLVADVLDKVALERRDAPLLARREEHHGRAEDDDDARQAGHRELQRAAILDAEREILAPCR